MDANEVEHIGTRFKLKEEFKEPLRQDPGRIRNIAEDLVSEIWNTYQADAWYGEPEEKWTMVDTAIAIAATVNMDNAKLYSELPNPPANIKIHPHRVFEIEYIED